MKHLWKHLMCTALCLCLLFSAALAEAVDINLHVMTDYTDADASVSYTHLTLPTNSLV